MPVEAGGEPLDKPAWSRRSLPPIMTSPLAGMPMPHYFDRLEKLARQYRRLKLFGILILGLLGVILATQAYVLLRPHPPGLAVEALLVRDPNGNIRASLGNTGDKVGLDLWTLRPSPRHSGAGGRGGSRPGVL